MLGIITIDGVAASGKSSVARELARRLQLRWVNSGLLYRAGTLVYLTALDGRGAEPALLRLLSESPLSLQPAGEGFSVTWKRQLPEEQLYSQQVDGAVSQVASWPSFRSLVTAELRQLPQPLIAEGRDMGTAVFPSAAFKFFLTAPAEIRARRRLEQRSGELLEGVLRALIERDRRDSAQSRPAADAIPIDTSDLDLGGVVDLLVQKVSACASSTS